MNDRYLSVDQVAELLGDLLPASPGGSSRNGASGT